MLKRPSQFPFSSRNQLAPIRVISSCCAVRFSFYPRNDTKYREGVGKSCTDFPVAGVLFAIYKRVVPEICYELQCLFVSFSVTSRSGFLFDRETTRSTANGVGKSCTVFPVPSALIAIYNCVELDIYSS